MRLLDHASRSRSTGEGASAASRSATNRSPVRILIADPDRFSRPVLEDMVRGLGYACDFAEDGERVYERCLVVVGTDAGPGAPDQGHASVPPTLRRFAPGEDRSLDS